MPLSKLLKLNFKKLNLLMYILVHKLSLLNPGYSSFWYSYVRHFLRWLFIFFKSLPKKTHHYIQQLIWLFLGMLTEWTVVSLCGCLFCVLLILCDVKVVAAYYNWGCLLYPELAPDHKPTWTGALLEMSLICKSSWVIANDPFYDYFVQFDYLRLPRSTPNIHKQCPYLYN